MTASPSWQHPQPQPEQSQGCASLQGVSVPKGFASLHSWGRQEGAALVCDQISIWCPKVQTDLSWG